MAKTKNAFYKKCYLSESVCFNSEITRSYIIYTNTPVDTSKMWDLYKNYEDIIIGVSKIDDKRYQINFKSRCFPNYFKEFAYSNFLLSPLLEIMPEFFSFSSNYTPACGAKP